MFKRESLLFSLFVTCPTTAFLGLVAVLMGPIDFIFFRHRKRRGELAPIGTFVKLGWCHTLIWAHGIKFHVTGPGVATLKNQRGAVFVSNHQSAVDIFACVSILPRNFSFVAKKELLWIPVFGYGAAVVGTLFIDRSKGTKNKSLEKVHSALKSGLNILLYPEGTRSVDGKLLPFKRGAFVMAILAGAPVVPITIFDSRLLCPKKKVTIKPGTVHIHIDEPISTEGMTIDDRRALADRVRNQMAKNMEKFNERRENSGE